MNVKKLKKNLNEIRLAANKLGLNSYLVGGAVRDLMLRKKTLDLDIVVEGKTSILVSELAKKWNATVRHYPDFGTFILTLPEGIHIDFATARTEIYQLPGALPKVKFSNIKSDLFRRDFTINAMAIVLSGNDNGKIIDFFGGKKDLRKRVLKVLHNRSFKDDSTRILRLARFAGRGFKIHKNTLNLVKKDGKFISKIAKARIREEILAILSEKQPVKSLKLLENWGILELIIPNANVSAKINKKINLSRRFAILLSNNDLATLNNLMIEFGLKKQLKQEVMKYLSPAKSKPVLSGLDLIKLGIKPGPVFKNIFQDLQKRRFLSRKLALKFVFDNYCKKS